MRKNNSNQRYDDEYLGPWPIADRVVSQQKPPIHKQDFPCIQPTKNQQTRSEVNEKYRYVSNNSVKHKIPRLGPRLGSVTDAGQEAKVEKNTAGLAYQYFRDIIK